MTYLTWARSKFNSGIKKGNNFIVCMTSTGLEVAYVQIREDIYNLQG